MKHNLMTVIFYTVGNKKEKRVWRNVEVSLYGEASDNNKRNWRRVVACKSSVNCKQSTLLACLRGRATYMHCNLRFPGTLMHFRKNPLGMRCSQTLGLKRWKGDKNDWPHLLHKPSPLMNGPVYKTLFAWGVPISHYLHRHTVGSPTPTTGSQLFNAFPGQSLERYSSSCKRYSESVYNRTQR